MERCRNAEGLWGLAPDQTPHERAFEVGTLESLVQQDPVNVGVSIGEPGREKE